MPAVPWNSETARAAALKRYSQPKPTNPLDIVDLSRDHALLQASKLQDLLMRDAESEETTPTERSQVARAWKELQEAKRILMGIPLPKPVEVKVAPAPHRILHSEDSPDSPQLRSAA